jgi:hypothetical protein
MSDYCKACDSMFAGTSAFDAHRTGAFDGSRRCLTSVEMERATRKDGSRLLELRENGKWGLVQTEAQQASLAALSKSHQSRDVGDSGGLDAEAEE